MSENQTESPLLDADDWNVVFQAYTEYPILAFILAQHLNCLKELIERGRRAEAIAGVDRAIESLMSHTNFRDADRETYHLAVTGKLSPKDDANLKRSKQSDN